LAPSRAAPTPVFWWDKNTPRSVARRILSAAGTKGQSRNRDHKRRARAADEKGDATRAIRAARPRLCAGDRRPAGARSWQVAAADPREGPRRDREGIADALRWQPRFF